MAASYRRIAQLLEKWPIDKTKQGRDFGEYLKEQVQISLATGKFEKTAEECDKNYLSLKRLFENEHMKKYARTLSTSSTGLTAEQCREALSDEFLEQLQEVEQPLFKRLKFPSFFSSK